MQVRLFVWALSVAIRAICTENKEQVALQARTLLLDDTTYFVGALGTVKNDATALVAYEYFAPCFDSNDKSTLTLAIFCSWHFQHQNSGAWL